MTPVAPTSNTLINSASISEKQQVICPHTRDQFTSSEEVFENDIKIALAKIHDASPFNRNAMTSAAHSNTNSNDVMTSSK